MAASRRSLLAAGDVRADALVQVAELHAGPLGDETEAESLVRDALGEVPGHPAAEALLVQLLEHSGRGADLAAYYVAAARTRTEGAARAHLLRRAAGLYRALGKPEPALDALSAAHGFAPGDASITAELAELLVSRGQDADAAPFDALLLQGDPFHPAYARHVARLQAAGDGVALGRLEAARAERQVGAEAARSWLRAAEALRAGGREDDARAAEDSARSIRLPSSTWPSPRAAHGSRATCAPWPSSSGSAPGRFPPRHPRCSPSVRIS